VAGAGGGTKIPSTSKARSIQRFLFAGAAQVEPDKQGRFLSADLRDYAGLTGEVAIVGVPPGLKSGDSARWDESNNALTRNPSPRRWMSWDSDNGRAGVFPPARLLKETIDVLAVKLTGFYIDGTAGGADTRQRSPGA
jgi:hypothetical protein